MQKQYNITHYKEALKRNGLWCTPLQIAIIEMFLQNGTSCDTGSICKQLTANHTEIKRAAILSALKQLCRVGLVAKVTVDYNKILYNLVPIDVSAEEKSYISSISELAPFG